MRKDQRNSLVEYVASLSEQDLRFLSMRLNEKMAGDLSEALRLIQQNENADEIFREFNSSDELYNACDLMRDLVNKESKRRKMGG